MTTLDRTFQIPIIPNGLSNAETEILYLTENTTPTDEVHRVFVPSV